MAKFALECPKCGSLNTASTFIFAKKIITCGTCNNEIDTKASRMISKKCGSCGRVVVCDQAKLRKEHKCPACGKNIGYLNTTDKYEFKNLICPQCNCGVEVDISTNEYECPICDYKIDVKRELARLEAVKSGNVSVIKYEGDNQTFIWKHPIEDFNYGSQLIVHESQEAVFFLNGEALDTFGPGRHTLETENLPILKSVYKLPTDSQNPFHAEVYFINKTVQMAIKWGTDSRVNFIEPRTGIPLDLGASGEMNVQVEDGRKLLIKLVGTTNSLVRSQIVDKSALEGTDNEASKVIKNYFRPLMITVIKTHLANVIKDENINILEIDSKLEVLSEALRKKITTGFEEYGLTIPQLFVTNVSLPEDNPNFKKIKEFMAKEYLGVRQAEIDAEIAQAQRKLELEQQTTELEKVKIQAEMDRIKAQAQADATRYAGIAEADVMAAKGYSHKDELQAEVQKAYAEGIGNMGGGGTSGGSMMSEMLGLGVGMAALGNMSGQIGDAMKNAMPNTNEKSPQAENGWKCACGNVNTGKFCSECGAQKAEDWTCANCGSVNTGKFCSECGTPKPEAWDCPKCGAKGNKGKFCAECGEKKGE